MALHFKRLVSQQQWGYTPRSLEWILLQQSDNTETRGSFIDMPLTSLLKQSTVHKSEFPVQLRRIPCMGVVSNKHKITTRFSAVC